LDAKLSAEAFSYIKKFQKFITVYVHMFLALLFQQSGAVFIQEDAGLRFGTGRHVDEISIFIFAGALLNQQETQITRQL
jgi:hypothetical protein